MKRIISFIISITLLSFCFGVGSFAVGSVTFSEDFQKMYISDESYSRINASSLVRDDTEEKNIPLSLTDTQKETVSNILFFSDAYLDIVRTTVSYKDGSSLSVTFIKDSLLDEYNDIINGTSDEYVINFEYPYGNTVTTKSNALFSEKVTLESKELQYCSYYPVYAQNERGTVKAQKGALLICDDKYYHNDEYYYVDFAEAGIKLSHDSFFSPYHYTSLNARKITDETLAHDIKSAEEKYFSDDFGYLYDDEFSAKVSTAFIIFVLVILPLICLVLSLIFAIRSKGFYRKLSVTVCSLSGAVLISVGIIYTMIQVFS